MTIAIIYHLPMGKPGFIQIIMIKNFITEILHDPAKLLRFGIIGITSTLIYSISFPLYFEVLGISTALASAAAYLTAMIFSFMGHKKYTFKNKSEYPRQIKRFLIMSAFGFLLAVVIMEVVVHRFGFHYFAGIVLVDLAVPAVTFIIMQIYVFVDK